MTASPSGGFPRISPAAPLFHPPRSHRIELGLCCCPLIEASPIAGYLADTTPIALLFQSIEEGASASHPANGEAPFRTQKPSPDIDQPADKSFQYNKINAEGEIRANLPDGEAVTAIPIRV